ETAEHRVLQAVAHAEHHHEHENAPAHTEHGEEAAELVTAQRVPYFTPTVAIEHSFYDSPFLFPVPRTMVRQYHLEFPVRNLQPPTSNLQPPISNLQPSTFNLQLSTFNFQLSTFNFQ